MDTVSPSYAQFALQRLKALTAKAVIYINQLFLPNCKMPCFTPGGGDKFPFTPNPAAQFSLAAITPLCTWIISF
jgi:hypothetical protein